MQDKVQTKIWDFFKPVKLQKFSVGKVFIEANKEPEGVYYLTQGIVRQFDISASGQKITLNMFKPGAFFPMSWAINKTPNKYFFECIEECEIKVVPPEKAVEFLNQNPDVAMDLLSRVYKGTDGLLARQVQLMSGTAQSRLAYELWVYSMRFEKADKKGERTLKIKKTELASFSGLARETVSRQLKVMAENGLIKLDGDDLIVEDINKLKYT